VAGWQNVHVDGPAVLDQQTVVEAACRLVERVGAKAMTMRMLADELGVSAMAAYRHVPSKDALLVLVADSVMSRVAIPPPSAGTWEERLTLVERAAFGELARVADLWDFVSVDAMYPNRVRLVEGVVAILLDAGFDAKTAALAHETIFGYVLGQLRVHGLLTEPDAGAPGRSHAKENPGLRLGSFTIDGHRQAITVEEYFDFGLRAVLRGLQDVLDGMQAMAGARASG
jgi:TetR/AcrR family tetracycline transcriptional repressor